MEESDAAVTRHHRSRRTWSFLLAAGCLVGTYFALYLAVAGRPILPVDLEVRAWVEPFRHGRLDTPMRAASLLGEASGLLPMILVGSLVLWRVHRRWALLLPLVMAGTGALQYVAKWSADRPRPSDAPWGFPSGHTLSVVVFAGVIAYLIATASSRRRRRRLVSCAACAAPVAVVGFSRIYLDMHWFSDVIGGLVIGAAYLLLVIAAAELAVGRPRRASAGGAAGESTAPVPEPARST